MKNSNKKIILTLLLIGTLSGCTALIPDSMLISAHQDMDKNHDGYIDYNEYLQSEADEDVAQKAKEKGMTIEEYQKWDFSRADGNKDGKVTAQELIDLFRS
jgi:Ca2+-binding EF-hand superfamily protein